MNLIRSRACRHYRDGHDLALPPDSALEAAQVSAPTLSSEPTAPIEDGWLDTASGDAISGEVFLPGQIFVFGGLVLRANSLGHLEQIDNYAPGHQVRFGNMN